MDKPVAIEADDVWRAIDEVAARTNRSISGLSIAAGMDPSSLNPSKRAGRWPNFKSIADIMNVTGFPIMEFGKIIDDNARRRSENDAIPRLFNPQRPD